jgi:hypothetical protein
MAGSAVKVSTAAVAKHVGLSSDTISKSVSAIERGLLSKCEAIPAAKAANQFNLTNYTRLLKKVYGLIPRLQPSQQQQQLQQGQQ